MGLDQDQTRDPWIYSQSVIDCAMRPGVKSVKTPQDHIQFTVQTHQRNNYKLTAIYYKTYCIDSSDNDL